MKYVFFKIKLFPFLLLLFHRRYMQQHNGVSFKPQYKIPKQKEISLFVIFSIVCTTHTTSSYIFRFSTTLFNVVTQSPNRFRLCDDFFTEMRRGRSGRYSKSETSKCGRFIYVESNKRGQKRENREPNPRHGSKAYHSIIESTGTVKTRVFHF